jgi:hypothetical protein
MALKILGFLFIACLWPSVLWAQAQQATVVNDGALVYQDADFDAAVINTLKVGGVYNISKGKKGAFYKIRLKPGTVGWIADNDVRLGVIKIKPQPKTVDIETEMKKKPVKPFMRSRYRGVALEYLMYQEDTMGEYRTSGLMFYGMKINGYNTMFTGDIYTDANILFHVGAPSYYADETGHSADGFIVIANFLLETALPQSKWHMFYYGFGPTFKYSHFNLESDTGTESLTYPADDMTLGAVFNLGLGFRLSQSLSLRSDIKYYWEKTKYYGAGLNLGFAF